MEDDRSINGNSDMESDEYEYEYSDDEETEEDTADSSGVETRVVEKKKNQTEAVRGVGNNKGSKIRLLQCDELVPEMQRLIKKVEEVLDVPHAAVVAMLNKYRWSSEELLEKYCSNSEQVQMESGVRARCHPAKPAVTADKTCGICFEQNAVMFGMPCGHTFCTDCWKSFVEISISEGISCLFTTCPEQKCREVVTEKEVKAVAPDLLKKYQELQLRCFVESSPFTRWCPGAGCEQVACVSSTVLMEPRHFVNCKECDSSFCLTCGEEPHSLCSCKDLSQWRSECEKEKASDMAWIVTNTKPCPKCAWRIEKNYGCNHMTCRRCRHEFCWICMSADWNHRSSSCIRNNMENDPIKKNLLLHYYKHFHAQDKSQEFAEKLLQRKKALVAEVDSKKYDEAKFHHAKSLEAACYKLVECRRVLKHSYVFAYYYLQDEASVKIRQRFEDYQQTLERCTEYLSSAVEELSETDLKDIFDKTAVVDRFKQSLVDYVEGGMHGI